MSMTEPSTPAEITQRWRTAIPLLDAMDFRVGAWQRWHLTTHAPLAPNRNDKQTGFAGSIAALANVTGWGLVTLFCEAHGYSAEIVIRDSQLAYRKPVTADLVAQVNLDVQEADQFLANLNQQGRARLELTITVSTVAEPLCAELKATYIARIATPRRKPNIES